MTKKIQVKREGQNKIVEYLEDDESQGVAIKFEDTHVFSPHGFVYLGCEDFEYHEKADNYEINIAYDIAEQRQDKNDKGKLFSYEIITSPEEFQNFFQERSLGAKKKNNSVVIKLPIRFYNNELMHVGYVVQQINDSDIRKTYVGTPLLTSPFRFSNDAEINGPAQSSRCSRKVKCAAAVSCGIFAVGIITFFAFRDSSKHGEFHRLEHPALRF